MRVAILNKVAGGVPWRLNTGAYARILAVILSGPPTLPKITEMAGFPCPFDVRMRLAPTLGFPPIIENGSLKTWLELLC
jgi:hypothetical protein